MRIYKVLRSVRERKKSQAQRMGLALAEVRGYFVKLKCILKIGMVPVRSITVPR